MVWLNIFVISILVFLPVTVKAKAASSPITCYGKYNGIKPDRDELNIILSDNTVWINSGDTRRTNLCSADLSGANLGLVDLRGANLSEANFYNAYLGGARLNGAYLSDANLSAANLYAADLTNADLSEAKLSKATLIAANLSKAYLVEADLSEANLLNANLSGARLKGANLSKADLSGVNLSKADLREADLSEAKLSEANLSGANLSKANLTRANLSKANLSRAQIIGADLSKASMSEADLREANLSEATLSETDLTAVNLRRAKLINTNLSHSNFTNVDLKKTIYQPISAPQNSFLGGLKNLEYARFNKEKQSGLVLLRNNLREVGLRELERQATFAIEKGKTKNADLWAEKIFKSLFFEYTVGYGLYPGRCLVILCSLIPVFSLFYFYSIYQKKRKKPCKDLYAFLGFTPTSATRLLASMHKESGIYRVWSDNRIQKDLGTSEPELVTERFIKALIYALYFSVLSAFHIGWRDLNVGNWITRMQPREYTLQATGLIRTLSGIQSLISIYLLALWVLSYFGRPFQ